MGHYVEPLDGQAARWLKIAAAGRLAADKSPLIEFLAARESAAMTSMAASLVELVNQRRADQTPAGASAPGEREYDPGRAASREELAAAPEGVRARAGMNRWVMADPTSDTRWLRLRGSEAGGFTYDRDTDLLAHAARITHLPTPVGQTPAGPVAAVATGALPDLTPAVVEEARRRYTATYTAEVDDAARSTDAMRAGLGDVLDWYRVEIAKHGVAAPTPAARPALSADSPVGTVAEIKPRRWVRAHDIPGIGNEDCWRRTSGHDGPAEWVTFEWLAERGAVVWTDGETPVARSPWEDCTHTVGDNGRCFGCGAPTAFTLFESGYLPDAEIDAAILNTSGYVTFGTTIEVPAEQRDRIRVLFDDLMTRAAAYCEREPEIRRAPAQFARGVDELTDDELDEALRESRSSIAIRPTERMREQTRTLVGLLAARLRVGGPRREAETGEITAAMLDAADVGALVTDDDGDDWRKFSPTSWARSVYYRSSEWLLSQGPLSNLRPPSEPEPAPESATADPFDNEFDDADGFDRDEPSTSADDARRRLTVTVHRATAARIEGEIGGVGQPLAMARSDVDGAARKLVAALDPNPVATGFSLSVSDDDVEAAFKARAVGNTKSTLREFVRAALETYAERLANRTAGGYDPAALAPGSVIVAGGTVCIKTELSEALGSWISTPKVDGYRWLSSTGVPTDGVLVVDGATLGGGQ